MKGFMRFIPFVEAILILWTNALVCLLFPKLRLFQSPGSSDYSPNLGASTSALLEFKDKWIRVAPKKRGRSLSTSKRQNKEH